VERRILDANEEVLVRLVDAECPEAGEILASLTGEVELAGRVRFLSDAADGRVEFAVIDVPGLTMPLVVRADRVRRANATSRRIARNVADAVVDPMGQTAMN